MSLNLNWKKCLKLSLDFTITNQLHKDFFFGNRFCLKLSICQSIWKNRKDFTELSPTNESERGRARVGRRRGGHTQLGQA